MALKSSKRESGQIVLPGELIAVIEEFIPDTGTYVKDGAIYSSAVGRTLLDLLNKRVHVHSLIHRVRVPEVDDVVLGQVSKVQKQNASIRIYQINEDQLSNFFTGLLHISDVQSEYVDSMFDICKPTDIIRGKMVSKKNGTYHLSTKGRNLGVVFAFCSACGHMLDQKQRRMHCNQCGRIEKRKTAPDYMIDKPNQEGDIQ